MLYSSIKVIVGGGEIVSSDEKTQGDPTAMGAYVFGILPLTKFLLQFINLSEMNIKRAVFADGFSIAGSLNSIKDYRDELTVIGPKYGYFPKPAKFYLIVIEENWSKQVVNIKSEYHSWRKKTPQCSCKI